MYSNIYELELSTKCTYFQNMLYYAKDKFGSYLLLYDNFDFSTGYYGAILLNIYDELVN